MKYIIYLGSIGVFGLILAAIQPNRDGANTDQPGNVDWVHYGGNKAGNRYSPLSQINLSNVNQLKIAWTYNAAEVDGKSDRQPKFSVSRL